MKIRKGILLACIVAIVLSLLTFGTYAYFSVEDTARNVISTGKISFEIDEVTDSGEAFPIEGVTVLPGDCVSKIVTAKNTGKHPLYVRIKLTKGVVDSELPAEEQMSIDINDTDWTYSEGYYYYNKPLKSGEQTEPLFTEVSIVGKLVDNSYIGETFYLDINGSAVQSENNGSDVFSAKGWKEIANDD